MLYSKPTHILKGGTKWGPAQLYSKDRVYFGLFSWYTGLYTGTVPVEYRTIATIEKKTIVLNQECSSGFSQVFLGSGFLEETLGFEIHRGFEEISKHEETLMFDRQGINPYN